ncbi:MAG TPA: helix-turn-helix domain-containing protein [Luteibacter sp.]|jgi:DNA-binding transcriptional regulator YiaG|uniref:helix-turn-helix domain-containing protein n=1 Tax=Luteibacter sp. TaxID=1886636 RepID=UPI002F3F4E48
MHHYTMCGLDNVWLSNGYRYGESPYGPTVAIADVPGLYKAIAMTLATQASPLSGPEIRFLRKHMEMSQESLASVIGIGAQSVAMWEKGRGAIPIPSEKLLRMMALGFCNGHATIRKAIGEINFEDAAEHAKRLVFREQEKKWRSVG